MQIGRLLEKDIYPAIGDKPVRDVTSADVLKIVRGIADRGAAGGSGGGERRRG